MLHISTSMVIIMYQIVNPHPYILECFIYYLLFIPVFALYTFHVFLILKYEDNSFIILLHLSSKKNRKPTPNDFRSNIRFNFKLRILMINYFHVVISARSATRLVIIHFELSLPS